MSSLKLLNLILEKKGTRSSCAGKTITEIPCDNIGTYESHVDYIAFKESSGGFATKCYICTVKSNSNNNNNNNNNNNQNVSTDVCPSAEGYADKDFQEWVWKIHLGKTETDTNIQTKLCGIKNGVAKKCGYSTAVGSGCGDGTKAVWKELKETYKTYLANNKPNNNTNVAADEEKLKKACEDQGKEYDPTTKACKDKPQPVDPDVRALKDSMESYRTVLNQFTDPTGWGQIDTLSPNEYTPNSLSMDLLENVTDQVVELINAKSSSSDFGNYIKMLESLKDAYNTEKYKDFFQKKVDPKGTDIFASIDGFINEINAASDNIQSSLNFNPLERPTEKQIRDFTFTGQLRSVYKVGRVNLMMMVYTYRGSEPLETGKKSKLEDLWDPTEKDENFFEDRPEEYEIVYDIYSTVHDDRNFENCKNMLSAYQRTYTNKFYDQQLLSRVKYEIQKCWCDKQYEELGKIGTKNMFNREMRKDRKELIKFLNQLPSSALGDKSIKLNSSSCGGVKLAK